MRQVDSGMVDESNGTPSKRDSMNSLAIGLKQGEPRDKYNYVYTVIIVIGIGTVLPWNTFINANSVSASSRRDLTSLIILKAGSQNNREQEQEKKNQFNFFPRFPFLQYFVEYKLVNGTNSDYSAYRNSFISYLGLFSMAPNLLLQVWNFLYKSG